MLIAKEKRKTNISEYFLYMYQVEDLLRACQFKPELIENQLVLQYNSKSITTTEIRDWYFGLSNLMEEEKLQNSGHLNFLKNLLHEVYDFHCYLLQNKDYSDYQRTYKKCQLALSQLKQKYPETNNEIQLMIDAIYGVFVLKLKKETISDGTIDSISNFAGLLSTLSVNFSNYEKGALKIE